MNWDELSGPQLRILREAIIRSFPIASRFDMFLSDELDKRSLASMVGPGGYEKQLHDLLTNIQAEGWTVSFVDALQRQRGKNPWVLRLPDAIRGAGISPPERMSAPSMGLEKIVQGGGFDDIRIWAQSLALISAATCRIEFPAGQPIGTGVLVAPDAVMTNYHVVKNQINHHANAADIVCRFGYARDARGLDEGTAHKLAAGDGWKIADSPFDLEADTRGVGVANALCLDYALLRLVAPIPDAKPVTVSANAVLPSAELPILIVQHPAGTPQALAIGKSLGVNENGSRFRYDADTLPGSSGSPVFNQKLELVAIHHAGDPRSEIRAEYNQGVPISMIVSSLQSKHLSQFWQ
ncbi:serine protease [Rhizobium leguminosarum bv. viciae]|uniref:trypsin-like peptidase domain-containing protein n=1 Tax=Rhizobium ruizarguesonis TaxID=2081791 RepID=UPI00104083D9|nr:trypsin-like peptidase domain-containing protein [Rhizobium ruizarguesonis]MBY5806083.1 trypsin-like peptidase domain-containing protein [Rhizobium leguminosarum]TBY53341.1 serine protease [Rhizobium leguminosarum bv. viciae]MBY5846879.1 trypsin-like peptidase domain-containing protein [Rhizobium leguminosarum]NEH87952.1 hypothetical protein [Rhizobium ruizarguesonis]NEJ58091.1 hypothetical protein [Rhizobium ruizarguesonis]